MNKFEYLLKKSIAHIYTTKDPLEILSNEYQRIEYIESTGTQYIDTGIMPDENTNIDLKYQYTTTTLSSTGTRIFGCRGSGTTNAFLIALNYSGYWYVNYNDTSNTLEDITWGTVDTNVHTLRNNGGEFYFDDVSVMTFTKGAFTSQYNALLMAGNANGSIYATKARVYYCKIYNGTTLIKDFVPCYRKSDGITGMYDLLSNTFFANAGTGSFIRGPEIIYSAEFNDLKIYGDSIQNEVPSPTSPVDVKSVGTLVTSGQHSGQYKIKILINNSSTLTPYYFYVNEPLRKIGTTADILDYKNGKIIRNIKEYIFKGTEAVGLGSTSQPDKKRLYISTPGTTRSDNNTTTVLCSHYPSDTANKNYSCVLSCCGYDAIDRSCIYDANYQTTTAFNAFALGLYNNNTPIKLYGILDTPVEEIIIKEPGIN